MIEDLRDAEDGKTLEADIVIIGGGVAGITLALELANSKLSVIVAESGGHDLEWETQALSEGAVTGTEYFALEACRLRYLGGSSNHWDNRSYIFGEVDFAERPWVPWSGWPIGIDHLLPFYARAMPYAQLGPRPTPPDEMDGLAHLSLARRTDQLSDLLFYDHLGETRFGTRYRSRLEAAPNVRVLLHANVTGLPTTPDMRQIAPLEARTLEGKRVTLRGTRYVLACGGLENPRLLLASDDRARAGVGNENDLVGRFFMEHMNAEIVEGVALDNVSWMEAYRYRYSPEGTSMVRNFRLNRAVQEQHGLVDITMQVQFLEPTEDTGGAALSRLWRRTQKVVKGSVGHDLLDVVTDLRGTLGWLHDAVEYRRPAIPVGQPFQLYAQGETAPNPDSRVTLSNDRDALGMRKIDLDWRPSPIDAHSLRMTAQIAAAELTKAGLARVRIPDWLTDEAGFFDPIRPGYHHMGTTRMSDDPRRGVVDRDCKMHTIDNLYVAGSSVYPTSGPGTPTLTLITMAVRLADHLKALADADDDPIQIDPVARATVTARG
ncbi:MAG: GMC family oxidoreductase [Geminicoccaceae bacterium]